MARDQRVPRRAGRPGHDAVARERVARLVAEQRELQGRTAGWRPIAAALPGEPVRLIQLAIREQKREERRAERLQRARERESHEVLARDAVWGQDATQLGRTESGPLLAEVVRDAATTRTVAFSAGSQAAAAEVIALLEQARALRGTLPLVWQTDNGSAYVSADVAAYLAANQVVHLRSRVRTPTDNPASERGIGELKAESGLRAGTPLDGVPDAIDRLEAARRRLDESRLRASRGHRTAVELDLALPRAEDLVRRAEFYARARQALDEAVLGRRTARARRAAQREAVWALLERHGLARSRTGAKTSPAEAAEPVRRDVQPARMPL
jgi:transposase InsO family protein